MSDDVCVAKVGTRHPQDYVLVDRASGDVWQMERTADPAVGTWQRFRGTVAVTEKKKRPTRGPKDYDELFAWLQEAGYTIALGGATHWKITDPQGRQVGTAGLTPSDSRSLGNLVSALRKNTGLALRVAHR